ncbi:ankyrin repeat, PH and SEC7 domain containing protein secG-like [Ptychodera flava]|uniref:ankyrin repeat, PH and SEC7 domain containing protein secG-like n=1 Tax=Ptychodera flava TaxID=63121 RepID=UPI00396A7845
MPNILSCCQAQDKEDPTEELKKYFLHLAKAIDEEKIDLKHINELLCNGADINVQDGKGKTPLHEVAKCWHPDVAKFMLDNNADVNKRDQDGFTPLHTAAAEDYKEMVEYLLSDRAEITRSIVTVASAYNASQVLCFLRHKGVEMNILDLREAARGGAVDTCTFLIETVGIAVNEGDKDGVCPLHLAAMMNHVDVLELLINKKACISAKTTCCQYSALFFAAANDATETLAILVKKGADIHQRDCKGRTPLMVAAQRGCSNTCSFLLTKGAQTDLIDPNGEPCIVTILTKVPGVAFNALDKFYKEDIGNRRRYFYLNNVEPNQPGSYYGYSYGALFVCMHACMRTCMDAWTHVWFT